MSGQPTPGPWEITALGEPNIIIGHVDHAKGRLKYVATIEPDGFDPPISLIRPNRANAEFIVRACNSHDELLEVASLVVQIKELSEELGAMSEEEQESRGHLVYARRRGLNAALWSKAEEAIAKVEGR